MFNRIQMAEKECKLDCGSLPASSSSGLSLQWSERTHSIVCATFNKLNNLYGKSSVDTMRNFVFISLITLISGLQSFKFGARHQVPRLASSASNSRFSR